MSEQRPMRKGLVTRQEWARLPILTDPRQVATLKVRFYKMKTPKGEWLIGDVKKAEFLIPTFTGC